MKKFKLLLLLLGILFLVTPAYAQSDERVLEFRSDIKVNSDTTINIVEKIVFRPSEVTPRHGLEWTIPYEYSVKAFRRPTKLTINQVSYYPLGNESLIVRNQYSRTDESGWITLRIGDPDRYINGTYVYIIDYSLKYTGISYFEENEEVYLNIIGPGWNIPIENASATLTLPSEVKESICFTGSDGSNQQNCEIEINNNIVNVKPRDTLQSYEGYTIALKQPKGTFDDTTKEQILLVILANIGILLPIPVGIFLFSFLIKKYKNPKLTVIPQYEPEKDMDPLSSGILLKNISTTKNIYAALIEMAIKGYYKIREYEKNKYEFVKSEKDPSTLLPHLKIIYDGIFVYGDVVQLKKLTNFYSTSATSFLEVGKYLKEKKIFNEKILKYKPMMIGVSGFITFFHFTTIAPYILFGALGWYFGILISLILFLIFAFKIDIRTTIGNEKLHYLFGLKMYIETAEKERIEFHNDPKKYQEVFEKLLPYAMIFNLEKKWAKQFENLSMSQPEWYEGSFSNQFNTIYFVNSLSKFNTSVSTYALPKSSYSSSGGYRSGGWSSGGSGFGGGGSSGGGGGGSGGGGW